VVGIFPDRDAVLRLVTAVLAEQPDEWTEQHRYVGPDILTNRTGTSPDATDTTEADGPPSALGRGHMSDPEPEPPQPQRYTTSVDVTASAGLKRSTRNPAPTEQGTESARTAAPHLRLSIPGALPGPRRTVPGKSPDRRGGPGGVRGGIPATPVAQEPRLAVREMAGCAGMEQRAVSRGR
jgi:hypothetical protein